MHEPTDPPATVLKPAILKTEERSSPWLTDVDACAYLCCSSVRAFRVLPIPYSKVRKRRIYRIDDLEIYALSARSEPTGWEDLAQRVAISTQPAEPPSVEPPPPPEPAPAPALVRGRRGSAAEWSRQLMREYHAAPLGAKAKPLSAAKYFEAILQKDRRHR